MGQFPKSFKTIEVMQQCDYGFTLSYVDEFVKWSCVKDFAYILHDKDKREDGTIKKAHIHLMLRFNDSVPTTAILSKLAGVCEVQHLNKMKSWNSAIAYLTHANDPTKHQYDDTEVESNFDWKSDRDSALVTKNRLDAIISGIDSGLIREYNYFEHITMVEYTRYKRQIDTAFRFRADRMEGANREMDCIYISGDSGTGKTTYAKRICEDKKYSYYVSSGSNDVLDGYKGQDAIILDDLRPSCLGLSDLLKMLDNNTSSSVKSRYRNKTLECKMIIITTVLPIETFFRNVFESESETAVQLMRRCRVKMDMDMEQISTYVWNFDLREYTLIGYIPNPIQYVKREFTPQSAIDEITRVLGSSASMLKTVSDKKTEFMTPDELHHFEQLPITVDVPFSTD